MKKLGSCPTYLPRAWFLRHGSIVSGKPSNRRNGIWQWINFVAIFFFEFISQVLQLRQLCKRQLFCQIYSTVDCKYLLFLQYFFFRKQYKNANIADCLKNIWKLIKQNKLTVELFDEKPSEGSLT